MTIASSPSLSDLQTPTSKYNPILEIGGLYRRSLVGVAAIVLWISPSFADQALKGTIKIDGSSTVYPITEAVAEEFGKENPGVQITVGVSGTGGGFKKFLGRETAISNASRPIKAAEMEIATKGGLEYIELPVAFDALSVVVNKKNSWANSITTAELKKIWEPEAQGKITSWKQVNDAFPDRPLKLFGAGVDSGTYDYFTEAICGKEDASRGDYTASEDDKVLVQGVSRDEGGLGFFGLAYYLENTDKLKAVPVDDGKKENGDGPQQPSVDNVKKGVYQPLARPLFIYVRKDLASQPEVSAFVSFYLTHAKELAEEVGYIPLPDSVYKLAMERFKSGTTGSLFASGGSQVGVSLESLLTPQ